MSVNHGSPEKLVAASRVRSTSNNLLADQESSSSSSCPVNYFQPRKRCKIDSTSASSKKNQKRGRCSHGGGSKSSSCSTTSTQSNKRPKQQATIMWEAMYRHLVKYHKAHGDTLVPSSHDDNTGSIKLSLWVEKQRKIGKDEMLPERIKKLNKIGFVWTVPSSPSSSTVENINTDPLTFHEQTSRFFESMASFDDDINSTLEKLIGCASESNNETLDATFNHDRRKGNSLPINKLVGYDISPMIHSTCRISAPVHQQQQITTVNNKKSSSSKSVSFAFNSTIKHCRSNYVNLSALEHQNSQSSLIKIK